LSRHFLFWKIDGIAYKRATKVFRIFEWKHLGEKLSGGQKFVYPIIGLLIDFGIKSKMINKESGIFIIQGNVPFNNGALVRRFNKTEWVIPSKEKLIDLISCKILNWKYLELNAKE